MMVALAGVYAGGIILGLFAGYAMLRRGPSVIRLRWPAIGLMVLLPISYGVLQLFKLRALRDYADLTVWLELAYRISRGQGAVSYFEGSMHPGWFHWFGTHFTPLIYPFGWVFRLVPNPDSLLIVQALLLSVSSVFAWAVAREILQDEAEAVVVASTIALLPTFGYINLQELEMLRFCIPALLGLIYFDLADRPRWYWSFLALAMLCREEVALTTFVFGAVIAIGEGRRRRGAITCILSLAYFVLVTKVVMPRFQPAGTHWHVDTQWFAAFGDSPLHIVMGALSHPLLLLRTVAQPVKLASLVMLLIPWAGLPLLSLGALPAVVPLGIGLLSASITHGSYFLYYVSPAIPFLFVGAVRGIGRLKTLASSQTIRVDVRRIVPAVFATALVIHVLFSPSPFSIQFWFRGFRLAPFRTLDFHRSVYRHGPHEALARRISSIVPATAVVSAEQALLPLFFDRPGLKVFPDIAGSDYVVIDRKNPVKTGTGEVPGSWDGLRQNPESYYRCMSGNHRDWESVIAEDGIEVFRRLSESPKQCAPTL